VLESWSAGENGCAKRIFPFLNSAFLSGEEDEAEPRSGRLRQKDQGEFGAQIGVPTDGSGAVEVGALQGLKILGPPELLEIEDGEEVGVVGAILILAIDKLTSSKKRADEPDKAEFAQMI